MCLGNSRIINPWNFALQRDGKSAWNSRIKKPWNFCNNLRKSIEIEESLRKSPPLSLSFSHCKNGRDNERDAPTKQKKNI
jgi:hypothetical protein